MTDPSPKAIAARLRDACAQLHMTNSQLAERLGVSLQTVNYWRKTGGIARGRIPAVAEAIERSIEWLVTGEESAPPKPRASEEELRATLKSMPLLPEQIDELMGMAQRMLDQNRAAAALFRQRFGADVVPDREVGKTIRPAPTMPTSAIERAADKNFWGKPEDDDVERSEDNRVARQGNPRRAA